MMKRDLNLDVTVDASSLSRIIAGNHTKEKEKAGLKTNQGGPEWCRMPAQS